MLMRFIERFGLLGRNWRVVGMCFGGELCLDAFRVRMSTVFVCLVVMDGGPLDLKLKKACQVFDGRWEGD